MNPGLENKLNFATQNTSSNLAPAVTDRQTRQQQVLHTTRASPAEKPEATAMVIIARWPLENNLNV